MERPGCPAAARNLRAHQQFIDYFGSFRAQLEREGASAELLLDLHDTMAEWLAQHICRVDLELRDYPDSRARGCR